MAVVVNISFPWNTNIFAQLDIWRKWRYATCFQTPTAICFGVVAAHAGECLMVLRAALQKSPVADIFRALAGREFTMHQNHLPRYVLYFVQEVASCRQREDTFIKAVS